MSEITKILLNFPYFKVLSIACGNKLQIYLGFNFKYNQS